MRRWIELKGWRKQHREIVGDAGTRFTKELEHVRKEKAHVGKQQDKFASSIENGGKETTEK